MARLNIEITATGVNKTDKAIKSVSDSVDRLDAEINSIQKTIGAFSRQQMVLRGQMRSLNNAFNQGVISQDKYKSESHRLGLQLSSVGGKIQSLNSSLTSLKATQNQLANSTRSLGTSSGQLQAYSNDFTSGIRSSNAVAIEFSRVIQDMPYGMQGVVNNLQQLTQNWAYYARAAREAAAAQGQTVSTMALMKGTLSSLLNPLNLITLGISLITAGWVAYEKYQQRANNAMREGQKAARDYAESLNELSRSLYNASQSYGADIARMNTLMSVLNSATATQKQRNDALKELQGMYPQVFKNYNTETILTEAATKAYKELTASIIAAANTRAAEAMIAEKASAQLAIDLENKELQKKVDLLDKQIAKQEELTGLQGRSAGGVAESIEAGNIRKESKLLKEKESIEADITKNLLERANLQEEINDLAEQALNSQLKVNAALLDTSKNTGNAAKNARDYADAIARVFDFDTSNASLINATYTNAEIQKVRNEYEKLINNVDRLEKEGLRRNKENEAERTRIVQEAEKERAEIRRAQAIAVADVVYRQDTAALIKSLNEQRDIYDSYEQWRKHLGEESANERYSAELATIRTFASRLETELASLAAKSMITDGLTDAEQQRFEALDKMLKDFYKNRESEENKHLTSLLKSYGTFEQKRKQLAEQYYRDIALLNDDQIKNRARQFSDDLAREIQEQINQSDEFRNMGLSLDFDGVKRSKVAVKLAREFMSDFFRNLKPSSAEEASAARQVQQSMEKTLDRITLSLDEKAFDVVVDLVDSFGDLVDLAGQFDGSLGSGLKTMSRMVSEVGNISSSLGKALGSSGAGLVSLGGYAGVAGAVLGAVGSIWSAIDERERKREQERLEAIKYQEDYRLKLMQRQISILQGQARLINDIYGVDKLKAYEAVLSSIAKEQEKLYKRAGGGVRTGPRGGAAESDPFLSLTGIKSVDEMIKRYNSNIIQGIPNITKRGTQIISNLFEDISKEAAKSGVQVQKLGYLLNDLSREDEIEIQSLIDLDLLDDATKKLFEAQIELNKQRRELIQSLQEELTGSTFESVADGLVSIFTRGDSAMEDFEKNFDELMRKSMIQSLKRSIMAEALKGWYERFADFAQSGGGLTESEISQLQQEYQAIGRQIKTNAENLERATGISLSDPAESDRAARGLTGSIERLSEQTGSELTGLYRATFELNKQELGYVQRLAVSNDGILVAVQESADVLADIASTNAEIAKNTSHLEAIATAAEQIARNTDNKSMRDIGL